MFVLYATAFFIGMFALTVVSNEREHQIKMRNRRLELLRNTAHHRIHSTTDLRHGIKTPFREAHRGKLGKVFYGDTVINEHLDQAVEGEMAYAHDSNAWDRAQRTDVHYEDTMFDEDELGYMWDVEWAEENDGRHTTGTGWDWAAT